MTQQQTAERTPNAYVQGGKTGWPPGLLQDDSRPLTRWFASRIDARWAVRQALQSQSKPAIIHA